MFEEKAYNSAKAHLRIDIMDLEAEFIEQITIKLSISKEKIVLE